MSTLLSSSLWACGLMLTRERLLLDYFMDRLVMNCFLSNRLSAVTVRVSLTGWRQLVMRTSDLTAIWLA